MDPRCEASWTEHQTGDIFCGNQAATPSTTRSSEHLIILCPASSRQNPPRTLRAMKATGTGPFFGQKGPLANMDRPKRWTCPLPPRLRPSPARRSARRLPRGSLIGSLVELASPLAFRPENIKIPRPAPVDVRPHLALRIGIVALRPAALMLGAAGTQERGHMEPTTAREAGGSHDQKCPCFCHE